MISRRTREETQEVSSTVKRRDFKRGIKRRGILPSFGDIVLPIVSVAAVCLLIIAGRQFFINGTKTSPEIKSTRAYADAPALIAEREQEEKLMPPIAKVTPSVQDKDEGSFSQPAEEVLPSVSETFEQAQPAKDVSVKAPSTSKAKAPAPAPASQSSVQKKASTPAPKKASTSTSTAKVTPAPAKSASLPKDKQWRVQIGAYGTKQAAQEAAKKIKAAGYNAEVYSNPASKHVKVWVYSGGDKSAANRVVEAMKKLGYKTSFAFPPAAK